MNVNNLVNYCISHHNYHPIPPIIAFHPYHCHLITDNGHAVNYADRGGREEVQNVSSKIELFRIIYLALSREKFQILILMRGLGLFSHPWDICEAMLRLHVAKGYIETCKSYGNMPKIRPISQKILRFENLKK